MPLFRHPLAPLLACLMAVGLHAGEAVATVAIADPASWSGEWKPADGPLRVLPAGSRGTISIPAWWGEELRPPAGSAWRIEIEYRDTATVPLQVELYAGLPAWRSIHRIGGRGDGEWRTARIPAPWDMVMRQPGAAGTAIALRNAAGADVPLRSVRVQRGDPRADEARWQAETRDWVALAQAGVRATARLPPAETPGLDAAQARQRIVPFVRSWHRPIALTSAPQAGEAAAPLKLRLAIGETEPAQFGLHAPSADVLGCTVDLEPDGLRDPGGRALHASLELLTAEYAVISDGTVQPQRLWPGHPVDLHKGDSHMFLLRVTSDADTRPGVYRGAIAISGEAAETRLPVEVEILPFALCTMAEAGLDVGMCADVLQPRHEMEFMARANIDGLCYFFQALPAGLRRRSSTEFDIDFTVADDFMRNAREAGIRSVVYYLGGDPYGYPDTLGLARELYRRVHHPGDDLMAARLELVRRMCADDGRLPPEVRELLKQWVGKFLDHAKASGWPEVWLSPFDEPAKWVQQGRGSADFYHYVDKASGQEVVARVMNPDRERWLADQAAAGNAPVHLGGGGAGPWLKPAFKDQCAAIHEARPDARVYASIHHAEPGATFRDDVDIYSSNAIHEDRGIGDHVRAANDPKKRFWLYNFCRDAGDPANIRYVFGFLQEAFGTQGSLCWAWSWDGQYDSSGGKAPSVFAHTSPYGVITQPHFEGMREALDDRRYVATLRRLAAAQGREAETAAFLDALAVKSGRDRATGKWDTVGMLERELQDPDALDTLRGEVIARLLALAPAPGP